MDEAKLIEKLRAIGALHAGATTPGERDAAAGARAKILERIGEVEKADPAVEYRFKIMDRWSRRVFNALLRRYGLRPDRYTGQHQQTVLVKASKTFVTETLWPEFTALNTELSAHLDEVTARIVGAALGETGKEADEVAAPKRLLEE